MNVLRAYFRDIYNLLGIIYPLHNSPVDISYDHLSSNVIVIHFFGSLFYADK